MVLYQMKGSVQMPARFLCTDIQSTPASANTGINSSDSQSSGAVERQLCHFTERLDDRRSDGEVRNEMPIHDVDMNHTRTTFAGGMHMLAKPGKISRKDGRCQFDQKQCLRTEFSHVRL